MRKPRKFSAANFPNMQTPCTRCTHPEWDHQAYHGDSKTACDNGGCLCRRFEKLEPEDKLKAAVDKLDDAVKELTDVVLGVVLETVADESCPSCPSCLSPSPDMVGVEIATDTSCLDSFHCPSPQFHGNPFRYCPHCNWREEQ